jgi:hypothetical protein
VGGTGQGDGIWCYLALGARERWNEGVGGGKQLHLALGAASGRTGWNTGAGSEWRVAMFLMESVSKEWPQAVQMSHICEGQWL